MISSRYSCQFDTADFLNVTLAEDGSMVKFRVGEEETGRGQYVQLTRAQVVQLTSELLSMLSAHPGEGR